MSQAGFSPSASTPAGLAAWAWQTAAELLVLPPVAPSGSASALDLGTLIEAIAAAQPQLPEHDQPAWDPTLLASLGLNLFSLSADAD